LNEVSFWSFKSITNQNFQTNKEAESPPVIDEEKVQKLGNLDVEIKEKRSKFVADLENMPSQHEFDKKQQQQVTPNPHVSSCYDFLFIHSSFQVVVNDKLCKLFETNNEGNAGLQLTSNYTHLIPHAIGKNLSLRCCLTKMFLCFFNLKINWHGLKLAGIFKLDNLTSNFNKRRQKS
jgi:hypothetical protein